MPKSKKDQPSEEVVELRAIMVQLGRALALTAMVVKAGERNTDRAIEAADEAWSRLADKIAEYAGA